MNSSRHQFQSLLISIATVGFKYDPFGRRIYKSSSSATSVYAYDGDNLVEETNSSGTAVARYSQGLNIDEPLAMLRSSTTSYYQADGLGSITSLSSGAGSLAQTYTFDSFGKQTASSGSLTNPFQYTARESDPETGLYYYRARYYDASIGRFSSEDPIKFWGGNNFYGYVHNSALNFTDPFGLTDYNQQQTLQIFLQQAYSDATAGYFEGLWNIRNHSTGMGDFDFAHNRHSGDTFNVCGQQMSAGDFGNFIAGFQGAAWDHKYYWPWFLSPILAPPGSATLTVIVAGQYYHVTKDTDVPNDPLDATGIPWILRGAVAGWKFSKGNDKCGCN